MRWLAPSGPVHAYGKHRSVRGGGSVLLDRPDGLQSSTLHGGLDGRQLGTIASACAWFRNQCRPCGTVSSDHDGSQPAPDEPLKCCHRPAHTAGGAVLQGSPRTFPGDSGRVRSSGTRRSQCPRPRSRNRNPSKSLSRQASQRSCPLRMRHPKHPRRACHGRTVLASGTGLARLSWCIRLA